jgi:hypothetical protein
MREKTSALRYGFHYFSIGIILIGSERITPEPHWYERRPRKDDRGVHLISDALPLGRSWVRQAERSQQRNQDTRSGYQRKPLQGQATT